MFSRLAAKPNKSGNSLQGRQQPNRVTHCFLQHKPASDRCDIDYLDEDGFSLTGLHWGPSGKGAKNRSIFGCTIAPEQWLFA